MKFILAILLVLPVYAYSQTGVPSTGNDIREALYGIDKELSGIDNDVPWADKGLALGYVSGVQDTLLEGLCIPDFVTRRQIVNIVANYFRRNPELHHERATFLIAAAIYEAYPCPE